MGPRESAPKRHFDRFIRFRSAAGCGQHTDHTTSLATRRIYSMRAMRPGN